MNPPLHIVTALSRPENLPSMRASLVGVWQHFDPVIWWLVGERPPPPKFQCAVPIEYRPHPNSAGGQLQKNAALAEIGDGWVWLLDDDNEAHPRFFWQLARTIIENPKAHAVVFSQRWTSGAIRLQACPENVRVCHIDAAQFVLRRDLIAGDRIPDDYCGDGHFVEAIHKRAPERFVFVPEALANYNALR